MRKTFALAAAMLMASITLSACHDGRPGHDSDRPGHHHHDGDHN